MTNSKELPEFEHFRAWTHWLIRVGGATIEDCEREFAARELGRICQSLGLTIGDLEKLAKEKRRSK